MAAIAFLVVRRRRQSRGQHNNTKFSGFDPHHDQGWLHMEDTNTGSSGNMHPNWKRRRRIPNSLRFIKNDLQSTPNSPQSTAPSPLESFYFTPDSSPVVPPPSSNSFQSINRQTRVRSMDQELLVIQEQIGTHRNSPQLIRNDPQSTPNSPDSTAPLPLESFYFTPASSPMIPPPSSNSFQSTDRQTRVRSMDQELLVIREQIGTHRNSPQLIRNDPQSSPNSPQPTVSSPLGSFYSTLASSPVILPPSSNPFQSTDRQTRVRSMDQELLAIQEQFGAHRNNPQYDPMEDQTLSPFTVRGPQGGVAEPALESSTWELRHQIQSIQEELSRREVK
ncbi:MAG: hypothetical protein J3R72DRAFT_455974 [Linnemannia gamsii]|nr:MAG: hypothetical protein J3R72DRAFT_455974 [Linnemannia gamsii]